MKREKFNILLEPIITEKSHGKVAENKYVFKVDKISNKKTVQEAVKAVYNVLAVKVNIVNIPAKKRQVGAKVGWKAGFKKAIVTLKEGDKIELVKGV